MNENIIPKFPNREFKRGGDVDSDSMLWLDSSYKDTRKFWNDLKNKRESLFKMPGKSIPFTLYNFFHDIILCNLNNTAPAFRWFDSNDGWCEMSYSDLGRLAGRKAACLKNSGINPGDTVCIINNLSREFLIQLLSTLKIGAVISVLPPLGEKFLSKRLGELSPDYIVCEDKFRHLVSTFSGLIPEETSDIDESDLETSFSYETAAIIFKAFDPADTASHIPVEVTSDTAYLNTMRDGIIALGVKPGKMFAAPGFDFLETQPGLILAVLINGGTFVHISPDEISKNPSLLIKYELENIGLTKEVRDNLLKKYLPIKDKWKCWFRNPSESMNLIGWLEFIEDVDIGEIPVMNLKWEPSLCGCSLFSPKIIGEAHIEVLPSAGCSWELTDISGNVLDSFDRFGLFAAAMPGEESAECFPTTNLVNNNGTTMLFSANNVRGRFGRHYPVEEMIELISEIDGCSLCSIDVSSFPEDPVRQFITLMVFSGSEIDFDESATVKAIKEIIIKEYDKFYLFDKYVFYPLLPRFVEEQRIDHGWCSSQSSGGVLKKKSNDEFYQSLTLLKEFVYAL